MMLLAPYPTPLAMPYHLCDRAGWTEDCLVHTCSSSSLMRKFQTNLTMTFLARWPSPLALARYSVFEMVERGLPRNSRMRSMGRATRPIPANIINSSHPAVVTRAIT